MTTPTPEARRVAAELVNEFWTVAYDDDLVIRIATALTRAAEEAREEECQRWQGLAKDAFRPHTCGQGVTETCQACWDRERLFIALKPADAAALRQAGKGDAKPADGAELGRLREIVAGAHAIACRCLPAAPDARCAELWAVAGVRPPETPTSPGKRSVCSHGCSVCGSLPGGRHELACPYLCEYCDQEGNVASPSPDGQ